MRSGLFLPSLTKRQEYDRTHLVERKNAEEDPEVAAREAAHDRWVTQWSTI